MRKLSERSLFTGNWLSIHEAIYQTKDGAIVAWEVVRRKNSPIGVVVIAKLVPSNRLILIKQFRPAVNGYIISFVAGLAKGDAKQALAELREETGYTGRIKEMSPVSR